MNRDPSPEQLASWHDDGLTYETIVDRTGLSWDTIRGRIRRYREKQQTQKQKKGRPPEIKFDLPGEFDLEEALDIADRLQAMMDVIDPVITSIEIQFPAHPVAIMFSSCAHLGGRYTWYKGLRETFDRLEATRQLYLGLLGDEIEGFLPSFHNAEAVTDQVLPIKVQRAVLASYLKRWSEAEKILFGCHSQHGGHWYEKAVGLNPIKDDFLKNRCPFFDGKGLVKMRVGTQKYILAVAHSFKGSSIYNPNHSQRRASLFDYPSADVVIQGDKHRYAAQNMSDRVEEYHAGLRPSPLIWHIQVGTAKVGADKYTIRGWQRGWFEWPILVLYPDRHVIKQAFEMNDLQYLLKKE